jgi:hypothetical protein
MAIEGVPEGWTVSEPHGLYPWTATHSDYECEILDGQYVGNGLCVSATSLEDLLIQIEEIEEDRRDA